MSATALLRAAGVTGLTPAEKMVLMMLSYLHRPDDPTMNPSPAWLSAMTGLSTGQVHRARKSLVEKHFLTVEGRSVRINAPDAPGDLVPMNWWPSEDTIAALIEAHPHHDFSIKEAVRDFIDFTRRRAIRIEPGSIDGAFIRNISFILASRPAGKTEIGRSDERGASGSVGAFLAGFSA